VLGVFERPRMAAAVGLPDSADADAGVGAALISLEVKDVDRAAEQLRAAGVPLLQPPTDRPDWRLRTVHVRDPDGFVVELFQGLPADPTSPPG
jgi:lactoylglutathione lyase